MIKVSFEEIAESMIAGVKVENVIWKRNAVEFPESAGFRKTSSVVDKRKEARKLFVEVAVIVLDCAHVIEVFVIEDGFA